MKDSALGCLRVAFLWDVTFTSSHGECKTRRSFSETTGWYAAFKLSAKQLEYILNTIYPGLNASVLARSQRSTEMGALPKAHGSPASECVLVGTSAPCHETEGKLKACFSNNPCFLSPCLNAEEWTPHCSTNAKSFVPWKHNNSLAFHRPWIVVCWTFKNWDKIPY